MQGVESRKFIKVLQVLDFINYKSGVSSVVMNYFTHLSGDAVNCDFLLYQEPEEDIKRCLHDKGAKIYATGQPRGADILTYRKHVDAFF